MPRSARQRSETGIYHVVVRGIDKSDIFHDRIDFLRYLFILGTLKRETGCSIFGYCLMSNHVHVLVKETDETTVGRLMHRLGTAFAQWYNSKYERVGHLFQNRFYSSSVEDDRYFLAVLRYIHQNPMKAGITTSCGGYLWSSYGAYLRGEELEPGLTDVNLAVGMMGNVARLVAFFNMPADDIFEPSETTAKPKDEDVHAVLHSWLAGKGVTTFQELGRPGREEVLRQLKSLPGVTLAQIASVTGFSKATISRVR